MRPTKEFIMTSFQNSGKKHLIITGYRNSGKTTLVQELLPMLPRKEEYIPGIDTYVVPNECVILQDAVTKEKVKIGTAIESGMLPNPEGFRTLGVRALRDAQESEEEWAYIDEIGFLESEEECFKNEIRTLLDRKCVLAVIRKQDLPFLNEIKARDDVWLIDLDDVKKKIGCVIMASGLGKRFGSNKLLASFREKCLYQIAFDLTATREFDKRVVVTRTKEVYDAAISQGIPAIYHEFEGRNDVVRLGIEMMEGMDACVFCPCDQPLLKEDSLIRLMQAYVEGNKSIFRLAWGNKPGTPILFDKKYFAELKNLPAKKGGSYIAKIYEDELEFVQVDDEIELRDVDTKADLELLNAMN